MMHIGKHFGFSIAALFCGLVLSFYFGSFAALWVTILLIILEVTLSFDNAVVNARTLERMTPAWQQRFLTWGILIAVFGTRFVLPVLIVATVVWMSPLAVLNLALFDSAQYGYLLKDAAHPIHSFGAAFLILVALKYFLDANKTHHWISWVESRVSRWGHIEALEIAITLAVVSTFSFFVPHEEQFATLLAGVIGILLFILMEGVTSAFARGAAAGASSIALFAYLEVLDAAFSLDGVIGAFALTNNILIIAIGLGVGAFFVRSLTIYMVKERTLDTLEYLEHGAHWAIFGLALSMFAALVTDVPEMVTGTIGIVFVVAAYWSSIAARRKVQ